MPMPQAMKIPDAEAAVDKEWEKLEEFPAWHLNKVKTKKRGSSGSTKKGKKKHCHLKKCAVGTEVS